MHDSRFCPTCNHKTKIRRLSKRVELSCTWCLRMIAEAIK